MGTSSWQNIPFCIELMRRIDPSTVLDVGIGFGRWGFVSREFLEAWHERPLPRDWKLRVDGIEAFPPAITGYHRLLYNQIFEGDALAILPSLSTRYDLVILGDVLEHFAKSAALRLMDSALSTGRYVLLVVPLGADWPQGERYGNPFERHLSEWNSPEIMSRWPVLRSRLFRDYIYRQFGVFLLASREPDRLAFEVRTPMLADPMPEFESVQAAALAAQECSIKEVRNHWSRWVDELNRTGEPQHRVTLRNLGRPVGSHGSEIWVLNIRTSLLPFYDFAHAGGRGARLARHNRAAFQQSLLLMESGESVSLPVFGERIQIECVRHPWSGILAVSKDEGAATIHNLFGLDSDETVTFEI